MQCIFVQALVSQYPIWWYFWVTFTGGREKIWSERFRAPYFRTWRDASPFHRRTPFFFYHVWDIEQLFAHISHICNPVSGESRHELAHSSNVVKGPHEQVLPSWKPPNRYLILITPHRGPTSCTNFTVRHKCTCLHLHDFLSDRPLPRFSDSLAFKGAFTLSSYTLCCFF